MATAPVVTAIARHPDGARPAAVEGRARVRRDAGVRGCVLLVDRDRAIVAAFTRAIRRARLEVVSTLTGREALAIAPRVRFDLVLLHLHLDDIPALDVVRSLRRQGIQAPFIAIAERAEDPVAVEAAALGAYRVLEEPVGIEELRAAVVRATRPVLDVRGDADTPVLLQMPDPRTAAERWCNFVISLVACPHDLKTTADWAKCAGVSRSVIRESCRQVHVQAHDARDFARMLRAIQRSRHQWAPESVLDVGDGRTLRKLEARSGLVGMRHASVSTVEDFLERQRWIPSDNAALIMLRTLLLGRRGRA